MTERSERAYVLAHDWMEWLRTRRFLGRPVPKNILAALGEQSKHGEAPDAPMSAEMQAFNASVLSLDPAAGRAFIRVYCGFPKEPVKSLAFDDGIGRQAYYSRAHAAAEDVLRGMSLIVCYNLLRVSQINTTNE